MTDQQLFYVFKFSVPRAVHAVSGHAEMIEALERTVVSSQGIERVIISLSGRNIHTSLILMLRMRCVPKAELIGRWSEVCGSRSKSWLQARSSMSRVP